MVEQVQQVVLVVSVVLELLAQRVEQVVRAVLVVLDMQAVLLHLILLEW
jgi:hypothetical protein